MKATQTLHRFVAAVLFSATVALCGCSHSTDHQTVSALEADFAPTVEKEVEDFDQDDFDHSTDIDNPWFPLKPGTRFVWEGTTVDEEGDEEPHTIVFTVTDLTKVISGVQTVVCLDQDYADGELEERELVFFAQDNGGTVWQLGEYPEELDGEEVVAAPCWIHGIHDGKAGIMMPARPELGAPSFSQGWAPSVGFTDRGVVDQTGTTTTVPFGSYQDVLVIDESNKEEPNAHQLKYYARGVGTVRVGSRGDGDKETLELITVAQLGTGELAKAREEALKLEASAYAKSRDVFAQTERSKYSGPDKIEMPAIEVPERLAQNKTPVRNIPDEKAKQIALKKVPGDVTGIGIERKLGQQAIVVEVLTKDGAEIDVIIDMETGEVLGTED